MPSKCRSFQDRLVVQISCKLTESWACNCILCHMALWGLKGLRIKISERRFISTMFRWLRLRLNITIRKMRNWWTIICCNKQISNIAKGSFILTTKQKRAFDCLQRAGQSLTVFHRVKLKSYQAYPLLFLAEGFFVNQSLQDISSITWTPSTANVLRVKAWWDEKLPA